MSAQADVVILGGGLAGLALAIQLRQRDPSIAVTGHGGVARRAACDSKCGRAE